MHSMEVSFSLHFLESLFCFTVCKNRKCKAAVLVSSCELHPGMLNTYGIHFQICTCPLYLSCKFLVVQPVLEHLYFWDLFAASWGSKPWVLFCFPQILQTESLRILTLQIIRVEVNFILSTRSLTEVQKPNFLFKILCKSVLIILITYWKYWF